MGMEKLIRDRLPIDEAVGEAVEVDDHGLNVLGEKEGHLSGVSP